MKKRSCIIKKAWEIGTPYIQGGGYIVLWSTIVLTGLTLAEKASAFDDRLGSLELAYQKLMVVDEKLDLVIDLLKDRRR